MKLSQAIESAKMHLRRNAWFTENDWRNLFNTSIMDFAGNTHALRADFELVLQAGTMEYDLTDARLFKLTEDPIFQGNPIKRIVRKELIGQPQWDWEALGTPTHCYEIGTFTLGFYPVPDITCDDKCVMLHGVCYPPDITNETQLDLELPFEPIDHPTIVLGAVMHAERIDRDLVTGSEIRKDYERGVMAARSRMATRLPMTRRVR